MIRILREERLYVGEGRHQHRRDPQAYPRPPLLSIELPHLARAKEFGFAEHAYRCIESAKKYVAEFVAPQNKCLEIA